MTLTPTTRTSKGAELSWAELDTNFTTIASAVNFLIPQTVSFSTSVPFSGNLFMPQQTITGALAFTVAASPQLGARTYTRLVSNGVNVPTFVGMKEWGGSSGYDNRSGIVNELEFFYDGNDYWYSYSQAVGATAVDTTAPTASSSAVADAAPTVVVITMSEPLDVGFVPATSAFAVSGHTVSSITISGSTINVTVLEAFANGDAASTVSYTQPGSNQVRDLAGNLLASFASLAITNNVAAPATAPAQVTGLTLGTATQNSQPLTWTAPSNGGSAITDYIVQWAVAGSGTWNTFADGTSTATSTTVTGLSASTSYDYRVAAVNSVGTGANSATSTGSTSAAATAPGQVTGLTLGTPTSTTQPLTWTAPADGGSAITDYAIQWSPAGANTWTTFADGVSTTTSTTVTGLTASTNYDYRVAAVNAIGTGTNSSTATGATTSGVTYPHMATLYQTTESGTGPYTYTGAAGANFNSEADAISLPLAAGVDGSVTLQLLTVNAQGGAEVDFGFSTTATHVSYTALPFSVMGRPTQGWALLTAGAAGTYAGTAAANYYVRASRVGSTMTFAWSADNVTWTTIATPQTVTTGQIYFHALLIKGGSFKLISTTGVA